MLQSTPSDAYFMLVKALLLKKVYYNKLYFLMPLDMVPLLI